MKVVDRVVPGAFLFASPILRDPNFARTVVLVCDHGSGGSWGLIVNRRISLTFGDLLESLPFPGACAGPVYWGGPCETARLQILHRLRRESGASLPICRNVELGLDVERLKLLLAEPSLPGEALHGYIGYAGWGPGQLAHELEEKSWFLGAASARLVFDTPADEVWERGLESLGGAYAALARIPVYPQRN